MFWVLAVACRSEPPGIEVHLPVPPDGPPHPVLDPPGGVWDGPIALAIRTDTPADLWYTLDGSVPTPNGPTSRRYEGPFQLARSALVRVFATNDHGTGVTAGAHLQQYDDLDGFSSNLPLLVLWSADGELPANKTDVYAPFVLTVFEPDAGGRVAWPGPATLSVRAGIRIHGSSTAEDPKHAWRVETWDPVADDDAPVALLGLPPEADWLFGAPLRFDRALMRNSLVYAVSRSVGPYAPRTRFAELFLAEEGEKVSLGDYAGVYEITETLEIGPDRVDLEELDPDDVDLPEVTGGYLFKEDRLGDGELGFVAGTAQGAFAFDHPFAYDDPSEADIAPAQAAWLTARLDHVGQVLASPGLVDPVTGDRAEDLLDLDGWIDHHILEVWSKNPDAFRLSGYYQLEREGPLTAGPVWDFDRTLGCAEDERCTSPSGWDAGGESDEDATPVFIYGWWSALFADPDVRAAYWDRWRELLDGPLADAAVAAEIEANRTALAEAAERNFDLWTDYPPRGTFDDEVDALRTYIEARSAWIRGCLDLPDPLACPR